ncbi:quinol:cytochrome c oxidoreductase membrane protein [Nitrospirillum amazonense]|uniref:Quinol:cytochrome c oxidoreductase membrane protein n=1 Tax=Nitrospirillum amazonense TaxID=28077 RepID=A0A560JFP6_9PROT|nr:DUF3341 domain-containing protein [Nitrospirillum amazonense]TWB69797.1 quinol:cytochrome c oxidoreductase membrane protein [Nitrospirillum amazonense]
MPERKVPLPPFGVMAEFDDAEHLVDAVKRARDAGFRRLDAYTPFPVADLTEALGIHDNRVPWLTLAGGIMGAAAGFGLQVWSNLDYPIPVGGRPLVALPATLLITFELTVLGAVLSAILGMLVLNRLPRLHHPVFGVPDFHLASTDKFFLVILGEDARFGEAARFLGDLAPVRVVDVPQTEGPE